MPVPLRSRPLSREKMQNNSSLSSERPGRNRRVSLPFPLVDSCCARRAISPKEPTRWFRALPPAAARKKGGRMLTNGSPDADADDAVAEERKAHSANRSGPEAAQALRSLPLRTSSTDMLPLSPAARDEQLAQDIARLLALAGTDEMPEINDVEEGAAAAAASSHQSVR